MKSVKRRDLKAILQPEPESPSVANLSALERLANQPISTQNSTNSTHPEKSMPPPEAADPPHSNAAPQPSEVSVQSDVRSNSLAPPPPPPPSTSGVRKFRALGGLRGETPSPAPLPPSPDVSELIFHAAGSRNLLPPQALGSPSPSKKRPRSPASRNSTSMSRSPSPSRSRRSPLPDRIFSSPNANSTQSTNLTPFAKRLKVSRQTPPPPAAALFPTSKSKTPSPRPARVSTPSPAVSQQPHVTHRDPSSSPVARSAPPTTPSRNTLPEEPGSSPFPEEDEDEKDDGPGIEGEPDARRSTTGDLDELEEFYGTKESSPLKDIGENNE
ncbi:hypothetical protein FS837_006460, partial [Tulasnella sp. UAMH 9824]